MRLIVNIDGTWYDPIAGAITVPGGVSNSPVVFQVNMPSGALATVDGSYTFDVEWCNNEAVHLCQTFNLALSDDGFRLLIDSATYGHYSAGTGWLAHYSDGGGGSFYMELRITKGYVGHLASVTVVFDADQTANLLLTHDGSEPFAGPTLGSHDVGVGDNQTYKFTVDATITDHIRIDLARNGDAVDAELLIKSVEICS